jgi:hypothetical protein
VPKFIIILIIIWGVIWLISTVLVFHKDKRWFTGLWFTVSVKNVDQPKIDDRQKLFGILRTIV